MTTVDEGQYNSPGKNVSFSRAEVPETYYFLQCNLTGRLGLKITKLSMRRSLVVFRKKGSVIPGTASPSAEFYQNWFKSTLSCFVLMCFIVVAHE